MTKPEQNIYITIRGDFDTKQVWMLWRFEKMPDDIPLKWMKRVNLEESQKVYNHSPDGFNWGYGGSGASQLALALCLGLMDRSSALENYMRIKRAVVENLPFGMNFTIHNFKIPADFWVSSSIIFFVNENIEVNSGTDKKT